MVAEAFLTLGSWYMSSFASPIFLKENSAEICLRSATSRASTHWAGKGVNGVSNSRERIDSLRTLKSCYRGFHGCTDILNINVFFWSSCPRLVSFSLRAPHSHSLPKYRNRGVYSALISARINYARQRGISIAGVFARQETSSPITAKQGFLKCGEMTYWKRPPLR